MSEATVDVADLRSSGSSGAGRGDDAPLRDDIRLLGRVLGEVIGSQAGEDVLELVESTRVEAFKIRRSEVDRAELARRLSGLDIRAANHVIRAFSHFSVLANLAVLLAERGDFDGAVEQFRLGAAAGDQLAADALRELERG